MKANLHNLLKTVLYILGPIACWCPMSPHFLTRWVPRLFGLAQVSWATARVGVHRLFPVRLPYLGVFSFTLNLPLDFICVSSLQLTYLHPFDRPITCWWWVSRLGTGSGTWCCGPRGREWSRNLVSDFCPAWGFNLRLCSLMAANVTTRLRRTLKKGQT